MKNNVSIFVFSVLVIYFVLAFSVPRLVGHEVFPFFRWDLFTSIPAEEQELDRVIIRSIDGERLDPPVFFTDIRDEITKSGRPLQRDHTFITHIANTFDGSRPYTREEAREMFERNFSVSPVEYDVVRVKISVEDLWKRTFLDMHLPQSVSSSTFEVLGSFHFER